MEIDDALDLMEGYLLSHMYSRRTLQTYLWCIRRYFEFDPLASKRCKIATIRRFLLCKVKEGVGPVQRNLYLSAIKFFYEKVKRRPIRINIKYARRPKSLPKTLSHREVLAILSQVRNYKHKLMIALAYGAGLRVSEVVNLRISDINFWENIIYIRPSKALKRRYTLLPHKLKDRLRLYTRNRNPWEYLFESNRGGKMHPRTIQKVFRNAANKVDTFHKVTFHSLRHSFATQLLTNGTDIRYIQKLLGHNCIRTTQIYAHVTNNDIARIQSPL